MRRFIAANFVKGIVVLVGLGVIIPMAAWAGTLLCIRKEEGNVVLSWQVAGEQYIVESSPVLASAWSPRLEPIVEVDGMKQMTIELLGGKEFFRLRAPAVTARVARGGALYDNWWAVTGAAEPTTDHPLWASRPDQTSNTRTGSSTWRCKECHGWDYKGVDGAYGTGSHRTGIAGIFGTSKTSQEVLDLVKTGHGYGAAGLSDEDIQAVVAFVRQGQIDTAQIIDENGDFTGDPVEGETLYLSGIGSNTACVDCHGLNGLVVPPGSSGDFEEYPGLLSNENPWEFQHKIRFGHPGTEMPAAVAGGGTMQDVADLSAYCQTLPQARPGP